MGLGHPGDDALVGGDVDRIEQIGQNHWFYSTGHGTQICISGTEAEGVIWTPWPVTVCLRCGEGAELLVPLCRKCSRGLHERGQDEDEQDGCD